MLDERFAWMTSEREVLLHYLNGMRDAVVRVSEGVPEDRQREPGVASGTNLLGLVRHLTWVEQHWFERVFLGEEPGTTDAMIVPAGRSRAEVVAAYRSACARSDDIVRAAPDLGVLAERANPGEAARVPLRAIVTHMIEETARHAGHADILRERIDGATEL
ncbi:DinB family protein [Saccharomonospora azurea]|uniref:DinB family protein n=1 Tax=Saccharomonospora azurea TaxID=40988 RepID=UPI003D8FE919